MISNGRLQIKLEVNSVSVGIYFDNASTSFRSLVSLTILLRDTYEMPGARPEGQVMQEHEEVRVLSIRLVSK